ncbi:MAG: hypothetical protein NC405_02410 [Odoribacter sp.]|nr:hypothetical protein [Odoribacter sp.]
MLLKECPAPRRVLVTGVTSPVGQVFLKHLTHAADDGPLPFETGVLDIFSDYDAESLRGYDTLLHLGGIEYSGKLVELSLSIPDGPRWLILVHNLGYDTLNLDYSNYRATESAIEDVVNGTTAAITFIHPSTIYGTDDDCFKRRFIKMARRLRVLPAVDNSHVPVSPVSADDVATGLIAVIQHYGTTRGKAYDLSGDDSLSVTGMFKALSREAGKNAFIIPIPAKIAYYVACALWVVSLGSLDYRRAMLRAVNPHRFSNKLARHDFGFNPKPFSEGIREAIQEVRRPAAH